MRIINIDIRVKDGVSFRSESELFTE